MQGPPRRLAGAGPDRHTWRLASIDDDGTPHVTGVGVLRVEGMFWFETGDRTRKARNLARDPLHFFHRDAALRHRR